MEPLTKTQWEEQLEKDYDYVKRHDILFKALYPGKFLLIHNETLISSFDTFNSAADEGIKRFENKSPYSVYEMSEDRPPIFLKY